MKIFVAFVFIAVSVTAYLDDLDNQTYYIQSAVTKKYLYVNHTLDSPNATDTPRDVSILETAHTLPTPRADGLFLVERNNAIGPYYNIIHLGTNSTLFATDTLVSYEKGSPAYKVLASNNNTLLNAPEAIWNVRSFLNQTYILNVQFGSYLYTNNVLNDSDVMGGTESLVLLLPSEIAGRALGTQWLVVRSDENFGDEIEGEEQIEKEDIGKMEENRALKETMKLLEERVDNQQGVMEKKVEPNEDEKLGSEGVVIEEKVVKTESEQLANKKAVEVDIVVVKEVGRMESELGVGEKKVDPKKDEQLEIVPLVKIEKFNKMEVEQGGMETEVGGEKVEMKEDVEKEISPWMTPMAPWLIEEILKKKEDVEVQMETGVENEEKVVEVEERQVQMSPVVEEAKENGMTDEEAERNSLLGPKSKARVEHTRAKRPTGDPNNPDFKAFTLLFNCHKRTSPHTTPKPWVIFWPYPYPDSPYARPEG